jgi:protein subunit release factor B
LVEPVPAEDDLVGLLADMYLNWAQHKGLSTAVVHESLFDNGSTRELVALVGGVSAYGVLSGEDGIHEFNYGKTSKQPKIGRFVRVRVLPIVETPGVDLGSQHVECRRATAKGSGKHVPRYKSRVTLTHRPSLVSVQATNGLPPEKSAELCQDWLQGELARRKMNAAANGSGTGTETVVRKYSLRPTTSARDERTGISTSALRELWNGALDVFLHARLAEHSPESSAATDSLPVRSD